MKIRKVNELNSIRVSKSIDRPSEMDIEKVNKGIEKMRSKDITDKIDPYFLQDISDRILGPNGDEYKKEIEKLNKKFSPRSGKTGLDALTNEPKI